ncbi:putative J domain-containing protein [Neolecta irregularis DAH-3]|uniref:Putative J domain-containing protein n=1 Tax=Neolecta irregularis (strain DAH-3) TaxID=1198029 RepID=A0A1U7LT07_NEOID|nr:putative J domain-containing protein [Neolecta irregularis DAH-3]|eukprot:OLL25805.1 putative J domain-containing protein [Neolecta irregularis DAH-3]
MGLPFSPDTNCIKIFDVQTTLQKLEGSNATFYSFVGAEKGPDATLDEISKAYRKKSLVLHPDKNRGNKNAHKRFEQLSIVASILRDGRLRERYDFFYKNGFPKWRGTGYYYSRFRPGLFSVLFGLGTFTSLAHYALMHLNTSQQKRHIQRYIYEAREAAWAPTKGLPPSDGSRRKVTVPDTRRTFTVGGDGLVYLVGETGDEWLLNVDDVEEPQISNVWTLRLVKRILRRVGVLKSLPQEQKHDDSDEYENKREAVVEQEQTSGEKDSNAKILDGGRVVREAERGAGGRRKQTKKRN